MSKPFSKIFLFLFLILFSSFVFAEGEPTCIVETSFGVLTDTQLTQTITITFNEDMNTNTPPTIDFNGMIVANWEATENTGWETDSNTIFFFEFTISDANEESTVPIIVSGAVDLEGNPMIENDTNLFLIDTKEPTGYLVMFDQEYINALTNTTVSFTIYTDYNTDYNYSYTISDGAQAKTIIEGNGIIDGNTTVDDINVSTLNDGEITLTVFLIDDVGNQGSNATDTITLDTTSPTLSQITIPNRFVMTLSFDENVNFDTNSEDTISKITINGEEGVVSSLEFGDNLVTIYFNPAFFTDLNIDSFIIDENAFVDLHDNSLPKINSTYLGSINIYDYAFPYSMVDSVINDENHLIIRLTESLYYLDGNQLQDGNDLTDYYSTYGVNLDNFLATYHYDDENGYYIDFVTTDSNDGATIILNEENYPLFDGSTYNNPYTPIHLLLDGGTWSFKRIVSDVNYINFEPDDSSYNIIIPSSVSSTTQIILDLSGVLDLDNNSMTVLGDDFYFERQTSPKYTATIYSGTIITGANGWDGNLILPTVTSNFSMGTTGTPDITITLGSAGTLTFSKAARVLIGGMAGKRAAYKTGSTTTIIPACTAGQISNPDSLTADTGNCYTDNGTDLIIWTKHFTDFAAYTPTEGDDDDDGGDGGSGGSADEEEDEDEASCSDIDITTTSITIYSDSTSTKSIALINDSEDFDFEIEDITITEASGVDVSIIDEPEDISSEDSEYLKIKLETEEVSRATTKTLELVLEGTFDDDDETDCSIDQDISVRIQLVSADEEGEEPEVVEADTNATTDNGNTSDDGAIDGTTDDSGANAISDKTEQSVTPTKKKSNDWLFWLLDLSIVVVIIALVLIIKKKKNPKRKRL